MDNKQIAKEVIDALGGRENVNSVAHCATRLRVMVKDENKINKEKAENIEKVQGAFFNSGQYRIIFGTDVLLTRFTTKSLLKVFQQHLKTSKKQKLLNKGTGFNVPSNSFGDIFVPLLPSYPVAASNAFHGYPWSNQ